MTQSPRISPWYLHSRDQTIIAAIVATLIVVLAINTAIDAWRGDTVELDQAAHAPIEVLIDINSAEWPEIAQLPQIGETLARRIVERREQHGRYREPRDLLQVSGIGPKTLEGLKPHLVFPPAAP